MGNVWASIAGGIPQTVQQILGDLAPMLKIMVGLAIAGFVASLLAGILRGD